MKRRNLLLGAGAVAVGAAGAVSLGLSQMGSMDEYNAAVAACRSALNQAPEARDLVRFATLAANSHNTQPWTFSIGGEGIAIRPDVSRRLTAVDPDDHHLYASLGCAAENLAITAAARGKAGELSFDPDQGGVIQFALGNGPPSPPELFEAITKRQSTRGDYDGRPVSAVNLQILRAAVGAIQGVDLILITDRPQIDRVRDLVVAGNSAQIADPAFKRELKAWLRFGPRQAAETGDGLFSAASGNPVLPSWLGPTMFDMAFKAETENAKYARQIQSSAGIAVFVAEKADPEHWVLAGRACQRFALQATAMGMRHAFINQPIEVPNLRPELASLVGMPGRRPDIVMRFGYGPAMPFSARRPVEAVLA
jgi:nitroreductase